MAKPRIQVYVDPETKRRVELAAAWRDLPVTEYCLQAITQQLAEDEMLENESIEIPIVANGDSQWIANLRGLREAILAERGGDPIDIDVPAFIEQMRQEHDEELSCLR